MGYVKNHRLYLKANINRELCMLRIYLLNAHGNFVDYVTKRINFNLVIVLIILNTCIKTYPTT